MLGQIGPGFNVFSTGIFSAMPLAVLVGGAVYLAVSLAQGRASFQTETARAERDPAGAETPMLRTLYALAVAVLVVAFVGFGIEAFYPSPQLPQQENAIAGEASPFPPDTEDVPPGVEPPLPDLPGETAGRIEAYDREIAEHDQVASVIAIMVAVLILTAGLIFGLGRLPVIGDGVTLGGVLTLLYGMVLEIQAPGGLLGFIVVAVGLIVLVATLYLRFRL